MLRHPQVFMALRLKKMLHEDMKLESLLTDYSRFKADCETILNKYLSEDFITTVTIRPATVCGYAPEQRLDLVVNILTNHAFHNRTIKVLERSTKTKYTRINDMIDSYVALLNAPSSKINGEIFNVGFKNQTVNELADDVKEVIGKDVKIIKTVSDDNKDPYHVSSEKLADFEVLKQNLLIKDAVSDLKNEFEKKKSLVNTFEDEFLILKE